MGRPHALPNMPFTFGRSTNAFTLIEMIAVLAILAVIVAFLVTIFSYGDDAVRTSTGRADSRMAARAALNILSRDIENAMANPSSLAFRLEDGEAGEYSYDLLNSNLRFAFVGSSMTGTNRDVSLVSYAVRSSSNSSYQAYELVRSLSSVSPSAPAGDSGNPYWEDDWLDGTDTNNAEILLQNVAAFFVAAQGSSSEYNSTNYGNRLPEYLDVYLEVLDEPDARIAGNMLAGGVDDADIYEFVDHRVRRYSTRIHFNNRYGQKER
jgi:prepilin-type N-terminal cleavage/methylation domain-containing protein